MISLESKALYTKKDDLRPKTKNSFHSQKKTY